MRSKAVPAYSLLFFLSGATGLIYQLLWVRVLYQSFGSTIQSITTVVAAYMGGLGLGAWLFGRIAEVLIELSAFGIDRDDGPALVRACWTQQGAPRDGREAEAGAGFR